MKKLLLILFLATASIAFAQGPGTYVAYSSGSQIVIYETTGLSIGSIEMWNQGNLVYTGFTWASSIGIGMPSGIYYIRLAGVYTLVVAHAIK
jgi:hypothetical protein